MNLELVIWSLFIGLGIATVYLFYNRKVLGKLVRKLIEIDACSPESAIPLEKIDYKMNAALKHSLRKGSLFAETVMVNNKGNYYINPERLDKAKSEYKNEGTSIFVLMLSLIILAGIALISTYLFPQVIDSFNELVNSLFK